MAQIREIKKRMVAVKNIQRITTTMQMIATARFTAALQRSKATQPYTKQVKQMVGQVAAAAGEIDNPPNYIIHHDMETSLGSVERPKTQYIWIKSQTTYVTHRISSSTKEKRHRRVFHHMDEHANKGPI